MFSLLSFLKNFSRMKHWWREDLQLPPTIKRSFSSSHKWQKLFERYRQLRLFPKQIICQNYFMFWIIFAEWIWFVNCFKFVSDRNFWPPEQRAEIRERSVSESLRKIRTAIYAPTTFRMVFYTLCYYFWGHHCCWTETNILVNNFLFFISLHFPQYFYWPLLYRCFGCCLCFM